METKNRGGRPPIGESARIKTSVALDPSLIQALDQKAVKEGKNRNALINDRLIEKLRESD